MEEERRNKFEWLRKLAKGLFALSFIFPISLYFLFGIVDDFRISLNQKTSKASVFAVRDEWEERDDGRRMVQVFYFDYRFRVLGVDYYGNGESSSEPPEEITIAYDANNPNANRVRKDWFYRYTAPPIKFLLLIVVGFYVVRFLVRYIIENYTRFIFSGIGHTSESIKNASIAVIALIFVPTGFVIGDIFVNFGMLKYPLTTIIFSCGLVAYILLYLADLIVGKQKVD
jgi:hypothetical protein